MEVPSSAFLLLGTWALWHWFSPLMGLPSWIGPAKLCSVPPSPRDEDMGLQWSLAVPTSYQWQRASILAALGPGPCQARIQRGGEKKQNTQAAGIKQRLDYPLNMSLSRTVHLWIPHGSERKKRHNFLCLAAVDAVSLFLFFSLLSLTPCLQTVICIERANKVWNKI